MAKLHHGIIVSMFLVAASHQVFAAPTFQGDWESGTVIGNGSSNWLSLQSVAPDRITLINDGVRAGTYARIEVRPGDNPLACCYDTDRAEVSGMQDTNGAQIFENLGSGTQRYSFSVKFDAGWQNIVDHGYGAWGVFLQLHGPDGMPPALSFSATDQIRFNVLAGDITKPTTIGTSSPLGTLNSGQWVDFILTAKFAADDTGFVNILRRDEGQASFLEVLNLTNTPTLQFDSGVNAGAVSDHYWKTGLYRNRQDFTSVLYLDGMARESVAAVPEPGEYALMLSGLALVGFVTRRRRDKSS